MVAATFDTLLQGAGVFFGAAILYVLARARKRLEHRDKKIDVRTAQTAVEVEAINRAVNHHPPEDPSLYTMVHTMGLKMDQGFARIDRRLDGVDERLSGVDDRLSGHGEALGKLQEP